MPNCPESLILTAQVMSLVLWFLGVISHCATLYVIVKIYRNYHIFFITFYIILIVTRILSGISKVFGYATILFSSEPFPLVLDELLWFSKFSSQTAALACVFERALATFNAKKYEHSRKQSFVVICMIVCTISAIIQYLYSGSNDLSFKITSVSYGIVIIVFTIFVLVTNRFLFKKSKANCSLSERYQLTENIKALRLLLPFVFAISLNALFLSLSLIIFNIDTVFRKEQCSKSTSYTILFFILLIQTTVTNFTASSYIFLKNSSYFQNRWTKKSTNVSEIRNVFGIKLADQTLNEKDQYFNHYQSQWN